MNSLSSSRSKHGAEPSIAARILIADDLLSHRELLRFTLEISGYEVAEADNCEQAIEQVPTFAPHLLIIDLNMPKMGGCAAAKLLHGMSAFQKMPIVALTAATSDLFPEEVAQAGFSEYLVKPVGPARLRQCISALL